MNLYIKNMVCNRCIAAVKQEFERLDLTPTTLSLGVVTLEKAPDENQLTQLKEGLAALGFELLDDEKKKLIEKIKNIIIEQVHYSVADGVHNFSDIITEKLHKDYSYVSGLFSDVEGITIEKYIINQKIEKVKELLVYNQLSLSEIAFQLGYSSVSHLSSQFKKVTGLTPSYYKTSGGLHRKPLDEV
jgi:AraC family transcriptional regulator